MVHNYRRAFSNPGTISDLLIRTFVIRLHGFQHVPGIVLLVLPYHAKEIIGDPTVWSRASWNFVPCIIKVSRSQSYSAHIFSANVAWKIGKERVSKIDVFLFHSLLVFLLSSSYPR